MISTEQFTLITAFIAAGVSIANFIKSIIDGKIERKHREGLQNDMERLRHELGQRAKMLEIKKEAYERVFRASSNLFYGPQIHTGAEGNAKWLRELPSFISEIETVRLYADSKLEGALRSIYGHLNYMKNLYLMLSGQFPTDQSPEIIQSKLSDAIEEYHVKFIEAVKLARIELGFEVNPEKLVD